MVGLTEQERDDLQALADDPKQSPVQREIARANEQVRQLIAGKAVREFCVEKAAFVLAHAVARTPELDLGRQARELTNTFYLFMTADLGKVPHD